jgi:hypothetical protein
LSFRISSLLVLLALTSMFCFFIGTFLILSI